MSNSKKKYQNEHNLEHEIQLKFLDDQPEIYQQKILIEETIQKNLQDQDIKKEFFKYMKGPRHNHQITSFGKTFQYSQKKQYYKDSLESIPNIKKIGAFAKPFCNDAFEEFSSSSDNEQIIQFDEEGYKIVYIGQVIGNRYIILEKLGWGKSSTVWLCKDIKFDTYVALKIIKGSAVYLETALKELEIMQKINRQKKSRKWLDFCAIFNKKNKLQFSNDCVVSLLNAFIEKNNIKSSNRSPKQHMCLSMEVLGESLHTLLAKTNWKGLPLNLIRKLLKQILLALHFLHKHCDIIHGDLRPKNILFKLNKQQRKNINENKTLKNRKKIKERLDKQKIQIKAIQLDENWQCKSDHSSDIELSKRGKIGQCFIDYFQESPNVKYILTQEDLQLEFERQIQQNQIVDQKKKKALKKRLKKKMKKHQQKYKKIEEQNANAIDFDSKIQNIMHKRSIIKHGNFKFDIERDLDKNLEIKLINFSKSCFRDQLQDKKIQKRQYRAPEVLLQMNYDHKADIWSLGCILFEMITGEYLFNPQKRKKENKGRTEIHFEQIKELLGVFPSHLDPFNFINKKKDKDEKIPIEFKNRFTSNSQQNQLNLEYLLVRFFQWDQKEAKKLNRFFQKFLKIDPQKRFSALELLKDSWLNETNEDVLTTQEQIDEYVQNSMQNDSFCQLSNQFQEEDFYADQGTLELNNEEKDSTIYSDEYQEFIEKLDCSFRQNSNLPNEMNELLNLDNTANWFFDQQLFNQFIMHNIAVKIFQLKFKKKFSEACKTLQENFNDDQSFEDNMQFFYPNLVECFLLSNQYEQCQKTCVQILSQFKNQKNLEDFDLEIIAEILMILKTVCLILKNEQSVANLIQGLKNLNLENLKQNLDKFSIKKMPQEKNWDKIVDEEEKKAIKEKDYGGIDPTLHFFQQIYENADEDSKRAMIKSFQTSNGKVLSTNWKEEQNKDYEGKDKLKDQINFNYLST